MLPIETLVGRFEKKLKLNIDPDIPKSGESLHHIPATPEMRKAIGEARQILDEKTFKSDMSGTMAYTNALRPDGTLKDYGFFPPNHDSAKGAKPASAVDMKFSSYNAIYVGG